MKYKKEEEEKTLLLSSHGTILYYKVPIIWI